MVVSEVFHLVLRYIVYKDEEHRLVTICEEANFDLHRTLFMFSLDCGSMCKGCIFCYPEDFHLIPLCTPLTFPRSD